MPFDPSLVPQIRLDISASGADVPAMLRQRFEELRNAVTTLTEKVASGEYSLDDYAEGLRAVSSGLGQLRNMADGAGTAIPGLTDAVQNLRQAIRDLADANRQLGQIEILTQSQVVADIAARRQQANAVQGVAREEAHLNTVLAEGVQMEAAATTALLAHGAAANGVAGAMGATSGASTRVAFSILNTAHAFQDLTSANGDLVRGLSATLNNIPLLVTGWASVAGIASETAMAWAGGLTIVAAGAMALYQNWDKLQDVMGVGIPRPVFDTLVELERQLKADTKEFEALAEQSRMTADELIRYEELNKKIKEEKQKVADEKAFAKLDQAQTKENREIGSGFTEAVAATGGAKESEQLVVNAMYEQAAAEGREVKTQAEFDALHKKARELVLAASRGDRGSAQARQEIRDVLMHAGGGNNELMQNIYTHSPEKKKAEEETKEEETKKRQQESRRTAALNEQSRANERDAKERLRREEESKREEGRIKAAQERERDLQVNERVTQFATPMMQAEGDGALMPAVQHRVDARQADADIQRALRDEMEKRLREQGVPEEYVDEVADKIIQRAIDKIRAEQAADGGAKREGKAARAEAQAETGAQRAEKKRREEEIAAGLHFGRGVPPAQARVMAPRVRARMDQDNLTPDQAADQIMTEQQQAAMRHRGIKPQKAQKPHPRGPQRFGPRAEAEAQPAGGGDAEGALAAQVDRFGELASGALAAAMGGQGQLANALTRTNAKLEQVARVAQQHNVGLAQVGHQAQMFVNRRPNNLGILPIG